MSSIIYKYDKSNRLIVCFVESLMLLTTYKYKSNFRKIYFKHKNPKYVQIIREELVNGVYKPYSSLTFLEKMWVYQKVDENGTIILNKTFTKKGTIFVVKTLVSVGNSSIEEMTFTKNNKIEKHLKIKTKDNGRGADTGE